MPFRNRLSRMIRKSGSSSSAGSRSSDEHAPEPYQVQSNTSTIASTPPMPSTPLSLRQYESARSRIAKNTSWLTHTLSTHSDVRSFSPSGKPSKRSAKSAPKRAHPSERPLTEQNLRHQELLGTFTMKFGRRRRLSRGASSEFSGVSPCNSRPTSVDIRRGASPEEDNDDDDDDGGPHGKRRMSSIVCGPAERERISDDDS